MICFCSFVFPDPQKAKPGKENTARTGRSRILIRLFRCSQTAPKPVCTEDLKKCKSADALFLFDRRDLTVCSQPRASPGIEAGERHFCLATFPNLRSQLSTLGCFGTSLQSLWIRHPLGSNSWGRVRSSSNCTWFFQRSKFL